VPNVFLRSKPTRVAPAALAARLATVLGEAHGGTAFDLGAGDADVTVRWEDGPAAATVADVAGTLVNWEVRTLAAPPARAGASAVVLDRRFSPQALAVAVVRYQASNVRPYDSTDERAVATLVGLLEVDDPASSGYPVPDAMAALLLAAPDPAGLAARTGDRASPADRLAAKLTALGYDRLWAIAWSGIS
jgi:hypothetical protein